MSEANSPLFSSQQETNLIISDEVSIWKRKYE